MHDLKPSSLVAPHGRSVSDIARLALPFVIFDDNVTSLKDLDRERMRAILPNGFEKPWDERCTYHLKF